MKGFKKFIESSLFHPIRNSRGHKLSPATSKDYHGIGIMGDLAMDIGSPHADDIRTITEHMVKVLGYFRQRLQKWQRKLGGPIDDNSIDLGPSGGSIMHIHQIVGKAQDELRKVNTNDRHFAINQLSLIVREIESQITDTEDGLNAFNFGPSELTSMVREIHQFVSQCHVWLRNLVSA